jgi:hypothetical protein
MISTLLLLGPQQASDIPVGISKIFETHCCHCHGNEKSAGDLKLTSMEAIKKGGHSGAPLIGQSLDDSELYLRISSTSDGYRMPKKGPPLSPAEQKTITDWMQLQFSSNRTELSNPAIAPVTNQPPPTTTEQLGNWLVDFENQIKLPSRAHPLYVAAGAMLIAIAWLATARRRRKRQASDPPSPRPAFLPPFIFLALATLAILLSHFYGRVIELEQENEKLAATTASTKPVVISASSQPIPPHPMHPPRLGGRYYRGNDERDKALFNNGFYRTATIDLHLVDEDGARLKWNDKLNSEQPKLFVELTIERAAEATKELFSDRVLAATKLLHFDQGTKNVYQFESIVAADKWRVRIPIGAADEGQLQGMVYLTYGGQPARPHYGIRYDISINNDQISPTSEIWMGSLYDLGGRVLQPTGDSILADRWFDWRPIPEIEGRGSTDPKLLGLPEHK